MKRLFLICFLPFMFSGCAAPSTILINKNSGQTVNCSSAGFGIAGAITASMAHDNCVDTHKKAGFTPIGDIIPAKAEITSTPTDATIYSISESGEEKLVGKTPLHLTAPQGFAKWKKECYQARKEGFVDSKKECREQEEIRIVSFFMTKK